MPPVITNTSSASGAQHQRRRGSYTQVKAFKGALGEVVVDNTYWRTAVNDGTSTGGWFAAKANQTAVNDTNYTMLGTDAVVAVVALSAGRTFTLPDTSAYPPGQRLQVIDQSGSASVGTPVTVQTFSTVQKIDSTAAVGSTTFTVSSAYSGVNFAANATSSVWVAWT